MPFYLKAAAGKALFTVLEWVFLPNENEKNVGEIILISSNRKSILCLLRVNRIEATPIIEIVRQLKQVGDKWKWRNKSNKKMRQTRVEIPRQDKLTGWRLIINTTILFLKLVTDKLSLTLKESIGEAFSDSWGRWYIFSLYASNEYVYGLRFMKCFNGQF